MPAPDRVGRGRRSGRSPSRRRGGRSGNRSSWHLPGRLQARRLSEARPMRLEGNAPIGGYGVAIEASRVAVLRRFAPAFTTTNTGGTRIDASSINNEIPWLPV